MLRRFLLPLLGFAFFATGAASAQTAPVAAGYSHPVARPRALTAREKRAAEATAKAEAAKAAATAVAPAPADATASTGWNGWGDQPTSQVLEVGNGQHRPTMNVSVAPGMPLNQVGHGVSTDYNGRPLYHTTPNTTLAPGR